MKNNNFIFFFLKSCLSKTLIMLFLITALNLHGQVVEQANYTLEILFPSNNEGIYTMVAAGFGSSYPCNVDEATTASFTIGDDDMGIFTDGCETLINDVTANTVLLDRSSCAFDEQCLNAQNAGAIAVIVCNNVPGTAFTMPNGMVGDQVNIPCFMMSEADCNIIKPFANDIVGSFFPEGNGVTECHEEEIPYSCDSNLPNDLNVQLTSFNVYSQDLIDNSYLDTLSIIPDNPECFFYTEDTLSFMHDINFNLEHNLSTGEQVYIKIWVDLNQDGISTEDEAVFTSSTTNTELSGSFTLPLEILETNDAICRFLTHIRVGIGLTIEEMNASRTLLFSVRSERPRITVSSKQFTDPFQSTRPRSCIPIVDPLLFYIDLDYTNQSVTFRQNASLSITDEENPTMTYNLGNIKVFDHLDNGNNSICSTSCPYDFNTSPPTTLASNEVLVIGIPLADLPFNPINTSLASVTLSIATIDLKISSTFYLGCCEGTSKVYDTQTSIIDIDTGLPYFFTSTSDYIEIGGNPVAIGSGEEVYLKANNYIRLKPGTKFEAGAKGRLFIDNCSSENEGTLSELTCNEPLETLVSNGSANKMMSTTNGTYSHSFNETIVLKTMPNPFQNFSTIKYIIPKNGNVSLIVYDILGKPIKTLIKNQRKEKGSYEFDFYGNELPTGVYFLNLKVDSASNFLKIIKS